MHLSILRYWSHLNSVRRIICYKTVIYIVSVQKRMFKVRTWIVFRKKCAVDCVKRISVIFQVTRNNKQTDGNRTHCYDFRLIWYNQISGSIEKQ